MTEANSAPPTPATPQQYTSTVVAPAQLVLGVVGGVVVALVLLALGSGSGRCR